MRPELEETNLRLELEFMQRYSAKKDQKVCLCESRGKCSSLFSPTEYWRYESLNSAEHGVGSPGDRATSAASPGRSRGVTFYVIL